MKRWLAMVTEGSLRKEGNDCLARCLATARRSAKFWKRAFAAWQLSPCLAWRASHWSSCAMAALMLDRRDVALLLIREELFGIKKKEVKNEKRVFLFIDEQRKTVVFGATAQFPRRRRKKKQRSDNEYSVGEITWNGSRYQRDLDDRNERSKRQLLRRIKC